MFYHPRYDVPPSRTEADTAWLFVLYCAALGFLLFIVMFMMDRGLPW